MGMDELLDFCKEQAEYLRDKRPDLSVDKEKWVFSQAVKLGEEVGELNEAVLAHYSRQRNSKADKAYDLEGEIADVMLVVLIMAEQLGVDARAALERKIAKIKDRRRETV